MKKGNGVFENIGNASKNRTYQPSADVQQIYTLKCPVYFVGFMGAGKTTVARRLARLVRLSCVDLDSFLEHFAYETDPMIVSCGGGIIKRPVNRKILKESGFVIYLQVSADEAAVRIGDASSRPMFKNLEVARRTNEERKPLYLEVADAWVKTSKKSVWQITNEVEDILIKSGVLIPVKE